MRTTGIMGKLLFKRFLLYCLACDEVAKARHRCYFPVAAAAAATLVFLKALYL